MGITSYLQTLYDPEVVAACIAAGVGAEVTLPVGAQDRRPARHARSR